MKLRRKKSLHGLKSKKSIKFKNKPLLIRKNQQESSSVEESKQARVGESLGGNRRASRTWMGSINVNQPNDN